jgi:hypothetical protein
MTVLLWRSLRRIRTASRTERAEAAGLVALALCGVHDALITSDVIRQQVSANAQGENLLTVQASWSDSETAYLLVDATINGYLGLLADTVAVDSVEAIDFWAGIRADAQTRADVAEAELRAYTQTLPELLPGEQLTTEQQLEVTRRNATLDTALADVSDAQARIDTAKLNVEQSKSEAGRQVRVVDSPQRASAPTPETFKKLTTLIMFTLIGVVVSAVALVVTTMIDHSVRSVAQLRAVTGGGSVATVARSKSLRNWPPTREGAA